MPSTDSETILLEGDKKFHTHASVWLLWAAGASSITMHLYHLPFWSSQLVSWFFFLLWSLATVDFATLVKNFFGAVIEVFFRDLQYHGLSNIPREGVPTLLVCAPHANQFVDPVVITKRIKRNVSFLCAAKSLRKPLIGKLIKATKMAVPVERPQDLAKDVSGFVNIKYEYVSTDEGNGGSEIGGHTKKAWTVEGLGGTSFQSAFKCGDILSISTGPYKGYQSRVVSIMSDTAMRLSGPLKHPVKGSLLTTDPTFKKLGPVDAKMIPRLSQDHMYKAVCEELSQGKCVAIFPEGGSHDRSELLPLKAGIAYIALTACEKYPELISQLQILPVGITYSNAHRFRSRAFVDFGEPISINRTTLEQYMSHEPDSPEFKQEKRDAAGALLSQLKTGLDLVTVQASDYKTMEQFRMLRRLYSSTSKKNRLSIGQKIDATRAFSRGYEKVKNNESVKKLMIRVKEYCEELKHFGFRDHQVQSVDGVRNLLDSVDIIALLAYRMSLVVLYSLSVLPGTLVSLPFLILTRYVSRKKQKEALAKSNVKIHARDVMATWKILTAVVFVPIIHLTYTLMVAIIFGWAPSALYFFWMPFIAALSLKGTENLFRVQKSFRPLLLSLFQPRWAEKMWVKRQELAIKVRAVVKEVNWSEGQVNDALYPNTNEELNTLDW
eukprot:g3953.t1